MSFVRQIDGEWIVCTSKYQQSWKPNKWFKNWFKAYAYVSNGYDYQRIGIANIEVPVELYGKKLELVLRVKK